jgi:uncharacterized protein
VSDSTNALGAAPDPLEQLLVVQEHDTAITRLLHRRQVLPERAELLAIEARQADIEGREGPARARSEELAQAQRAIEAQVAAINTRRHELEQRMYSARGAAARDLQAMDAEVRQLGEHRAELEDEELTLLEEQEPLDALVGALVAERTDLDARASTLRTALAAAESEIDAEIAQIRDRRGIDAQALPADLADRYESLRTRLGGVGAARLVGNRCEGCHLELPAMEVDRIRHLPPDAVVTCEQCGRILVRSAPRA